MNVFIHLRNNFVEERILSITRLLGDSKFSFFWKEASLSHVELFFCLKKAQTAK